MKLQNYIYQCANCNNKFKEPELFSEVYGEFLLRSTSGEKRYLYAIESDAFLEFGREVDKYLGKTSITELGRAKILHLIFGIACDLASDNTEYTIGGNPICPRCKSNRMHSWEPIYPDEVIELDVPYVTHKEWGKLNTIQKNTRIENAIDCVLKNKEKFEII